MKLVNDRTIGAWIPLPSPLEGLIARLGRLSKAPAFAAQRQMALSRALQSYLATANEAPLAPLDQEVHLAELYVYADYYPEDGQLTLIEQLRDVITEHIPEEERQWLDPFKHSYMDLIEILPSSGEKSLLLCRSQGNGRRYRVRLDEPKPEFRVGQVLLARMSRLPGDTETEEAVIAGSALVLSAEDAKTLYEATGEYRREMEIAGGSFELGDWPEFAKRFGHILLWNVARMRVAALVDAVVSIRYVSSQDGQPFLYAIALYEHHEFTYLADSLSEIDGLSQRPIPGSDREATAEIRRRTWILQDPKGGSGTGVVGRLTLTPSQLIVECESRERLDQVKHRLAATYGFSLHFRGETTTPPRRDVTAAQLATDEPVTLLISPEEDRALLRTFLETVYLEWADQESPALGGKTPRHAAVSHEGRSNVAALIHVMEANDPGLRRTGTLAFDYNILRAHVGLEEVAQ